MTKEAALINASIIQSLMVQLNCFESVHFIVWNSGNECEVYGHYDPSKVDFSRLEAGFRLPVALDAYFEDRSIEGHTNRVFCFTWLWDE